MQSPDRDSTLRVPLLDPFSAADQQGSQRNDVNNWKASLRRMAKDFLQQLSLAGPLAVNLVTANAVACINLFFVARGGTQQLAAAALGNNVAVMFGRLVLLGLCGALDTLAAQAWGAGKERRLPLLLQRTVLFLWLHCAAISAAMLALPSGLRALGVDGGLTDMVRAYLIALLPSVWLEAMSRPITRVLVARGTVAPQMAIALMGLPLNVATNYGLVVAAGWQYVGAAAAMSAAAGYDLILLLLYVGVSGQWGDVVGAPTWRAFKGWRQLSRLAYPAASMKCAESWAFTICTLAASLLPDACTATAAVGVSYNVYGVLFIAFVACSTAACVTVGNRLGAGDARGAKLAAAGSLLIVPPAWGVAALALLLPACQDAIMGLFAGPASAGPGGQDPDAAAQADAEAAALRGVLRHMFVIVAGLVLLDGVQTVLSGIIQGCGRQQAGALVNLVAFYVVALPLALGLAFRTTLPAALGGGVAGLGMGPEGLYLGMAAGPAIQTACYVFILLRTNWESMSAAAVSLAQMGSTASLAGLIHRLDPGALTGPPLSRSGSGAGMVSVGPSWLLPAIEERSGEGRDSSDSLSLGAGSGALSASFPISAKGSATGCVTASGESNGSGGGDGSICAWLQANSSALAAAFGEQAAGGGCDKSANGQRNGSAAVGGAAAAAARLSPRRQSSRLRSVGSGGGSPLRLTATSGTAAASCSSSTTPAPAAPPPPPADETAAAKGMAAGPMAATTEDASPGTAARSRALIMTHGSPPRTDAARHCLLAATLEPGSPATTTAVAATAAGPVSVPGCLGGLLACTSPNLPGPLHAHSPPHARAPAPAAAAAAVFSATAGGAAVRWFRFGRWGRTTAAVPAKGEAMAGAATAVPATAGPGMASQAAANGAPLQLPGVINDDASTADGAMSGAGAGLPSTSPTAAAAATPPLAIAPFASGPGSASGSGRHRSQAGRGPYEDVDGDRAGSVTGQFDSAASSGGGGSSTGSGSGSGGPGRGLGELGARGEVFRSCESLAAAVPGAEDFYAFSTSAGTDGGAWLDPPAALAMAQEPSAQPGIATSATGSGGGGDGHAGAVVVTVAECGGVRKA